MADPIAERIAHQTLHRLVTPLRVAARYVQAAEVQSVKISPNDPNVEMMKLRLTGAGWEYSVQAPKKATHAHTDKKRASARQKLRYMMRNSMNLTNTDKLLKELDEAFDKKYPDGKTAAGYVIGPRGLQEPESGITLQKGAMYGLGASSSPSLVILTDVSDTKVKYVTYPFSGSPLTMEAWIAKDLLAKGTRTYLRNGGSYIDKKLKSSMESLLKGGKGISENMNDWKQVTIQAVAAEPGKDEWRAAEEYGNVGGLDDPEHGMIYEIESFNSEVPKIKKDKRLKVLKVVNR